MVESSAQQKVKEFRSLLELERDRKEKEVKVETARRILGGDEFSFAEEQTAAIEEASDS